MKKRNLKTLQLSKKSISSLSNLNGITGGAESLRLCDTDISCDTKYFCDTWASCDPIALTDFCNPVRP